MSEERSVTHGSGTQALEKLREMGAPDLVTASVERRLMPPPERPRGRVTHGPEMVEQRKKPREGLERGKPKVYEALQRSGAAYKELRERAGVGKETFCRALYDRVGAPSARAIAAVLGEGQAEGDVRVLEGELQEPPEKNLEKSRARVSRFRRSGLNDS